MRARPVSVAIIAWLFIAVGVVGLVSAALPLLDGAPAGRIDDRHEIVDAALAATSSLLSLLGGAFLLRGRNWARWLLVGWMVFHIVLSGLHSPSKLLVHCVLFAPILLFLFCPRASAYFTARRDAGDS